MTTKAVALSLLLALLLAACQTTPATSQLQPVKLVLAWTHESEFAGFYVADSQGYFGDAGLAVEIVEGGIDVDEYALLTEGQVDFAVMTLNEYKAAVAEDDSIIAVAATFQIPPPVFFAKANSGISTPQDFAGKRVAIKHEGWRGIFTEMLTNAGVDVAAVTQVDVPDDITLFYNNEVDVWSGYVHDEVTEARLGGHDIQIIFPYEYGVGSYEGLVVTTKETIGQRPEQVKGLLEASVKGWQYAIEHPDETAAITEKWQPQYNQEFHRTAFAELIPLVDTGTAPILSIDPDRWLDSMAGVATSDDPKVDLTFISQIQP
ncbi:MAG: ABC transporter substrate-binding protein [Anaerolineae bacterium]